MLEKPLKRVSRPNADVRLSNLVGGNTHRHIRIHIYVYILYIYINTYIERKRPKYEIESWRTCKISLHKTIIIAMMSSKGEAEKTSLCNVSPHQIHEHNGGQGDVGS